MSRYNLHLEKVATCPLSDSEASTKYDQVYDTLVGEINRYLPDDEALLGSCKNIRVACNGCGLIYLSPRISTLGLKEVYRLWYAYAYRSVFADDRHVKLRRNEFKRNHLRLLNHKTTAKGRLFDVGCGTGLFIDVANRDGWQATGIEFDTATAEWGHQITVSIFGLKH